MLEMFREEIHASGGRVSDQVSDGPRLLVRSLLPEGCEVTIDDCVRQGVALR